MAKVFKNSVPQGDRGSGMGTDDQTPELLIRHGDNDLFGN
jgi:hypothetical protein